LPHHSILSKAGKSIKTSLGPYRMYYHGYGTEEPSHYDYKKRFAGLEFYDWKGNWRLLVEAEA
jgi:hypothetical protein